MAAQVERNVELSVLLKEETPRETVAFFYGE
jgi:hypothetical protein